MSPLLDDVIGVAHNRMILSRRVTVLSKWFAELMPPQARVLDVGCGDGALSARLGALRSDLAIEGVDVLAREKSQIPVTLFDGTRLPFDDESFDAVMFSDVLHHTADPTVLQREARRVARRHVLIKDHFVAGFAANARLRAMDWVGNARFGVSLPYNYWREAEWLAVWSSLGLRLERIVRELGLYAEPLNRVTGAGLHFVARLEKADMRPE
ncbi:MAG: class I SAM-dependent methyltransferase [Gemmatimonadota bacterium]